MPARFLQLPPMGKYIGHKPAAIRALSTFRTGQPIVGTYYFYWYDVNTREHFVDPDGTDALTDHPLNPQGYSYRSVDWHRREMEDILRAGIDFILPVYWGNPADRQPGKGLYWSFEGLAALVKAQEQMLAAKRRPPKIGLFYDTSTLQWNADNYHADLTTHEGQEWFYVSIRDFFSMVPPKLWAMVYHRPLIFLYAAAFAKDYNQQAIDFVYQQFAKDFGCRPYIVREVSWGKVRTDSVYAWGGALAPAILEVAAIGPGYDHSAVPGRAPLVRDREGGKFFERSWEQILRMNPKRRPFIVMIETWNELHEGTDICPSREYGDQYVKINARYANLFRRRVQLRPQGAYSKAQEVSIVLERQPVERGIRLHIDPNGDGLMEPAEAGGVSAWRTLPNRHHNVRFAYFDVDDSFYFDGDEPVQVEIEVWDAIREFTLEYDSSDPAGGPHQGAFKLAQRFTPGGTGAWQTFRVSLKDARFANRGNGADFRLGSGEELLIRRVTVRREGKR
jgi:hypothetical protein